MTATEVLKKGVLSALAGGNQHEKTYNKALLCLAVGAYAFIGNDCIARKCNRGKG